MELTIRPATPAERLFAYEQSAQISEQCGNPGYLWGELDNSGSIFLNSWQTFVRSQNTPEFKAEFNAVLDMLRLSGKAVDIANLGDDTGRIDFTDSRD